MLESAIRPGVVAIIGGVLVAIASAVPFVALEYRRFGRLTLRSAAGGLAIAVYGCALVTYTLLPLPDGALEACVPPQSVPFRSAIDIVRLGIGSPGALVRNGALQQVLLNVVLFLPLGVIVRRFTRWPVLVVGAVGLGVSALIETTQLTGIWTLYPCAYRVADVDDLITNTAGALLGAVAAPLLGRRRPAIAPPEERPTRISFGRRFAGMVVDVLAVAVTGVLATLLWQAPVALADGRTPQPWNDVLGWVTGSLVPAAVQLAWVLRSGQSVGEQAVRLQPVTRPSTERLVLRWAFGIGGWSLLSDVSPASGLLVIATLVALIATKDRRGLAYAVAGMRVRVSPPPSVGVRAASPRSEQHEP